MSHKSGGASVTAVTRLKKDYIRIMKDPVPFVLAAPRHDNILEWRYVVRGAPNTPFDGGVYHGKLVFPAEFPFKPPSIYMLTPNGRFQINQRLCLSISDFHPEKWNPAWTVSTILNGLLSFMNENHQTFGSINTSDYEKRVFAARSLDFNLKDKLFCELFPDLAKELREELAKRNESSDADAKDAADAQSDAAKRRGTEPLGLFDRSSMTYNLLVVCGVVALGFAVKYVLTSAYDADFQS